MSEYTTGRPAVSSAAAGLVGAMASAVQTPFPRDLRSAAGRVGHGAMASAVQTPFPRGCSSGRTKRVRAANDMDRVLMNLRRGCSSGRTKRVRAEQRPLLSRLHFHVGRPPRRGSARRGATASPVQTPFPRRSWGTHRPPRYRGATASPVQTPFPRVVHDRDGDPRHHEQRPLLSRLHFHVNKAAIGTGADDRATASPVQTPFPRSPPQLLANGRWGRRPASGSCFAPSRWGGKQGPLAGVVSRPPRRGPARRARRQPRRERHGRRAVSAPPQRTLHRPGSKPQVRSRPPPGGRQRVRVSPCSPASASPVSLPGSCDAPRRRSTPP